MKVYNTDIEQMVIEQTLKLIVARGLKGWNMMDLANQTGLAKQTLYKIIGSKEQVIERVVFLQMKKTFEGVDLIMEESANYGEFIKRFIEIGPRYLSKVSRITLTEIYREYPAIEKKADKYKQKVYSTRIEFFQRGIDEGYLRDDITPEFLLDLVRDGILEHYIRSGFTGEKLEKALGLAFKCLSEGTMARN